MKQVINGKIYNTETAEKLHEYNNGMGNDFRAYDEALYLTKKGAFFIAGSGGPMTKYAKSCGNMTTGSSGIRVISKFDALKWLETHDGDHVLTERFPDEIEEA